jgi:hypothetical protein
VTTVEQWEGSVWPEPGPGATRLVRTCTALRRKPVADFTTEDLRVMIGQRIGVGLLLGPAVDLLLADPLAEGDLFPGDLLSAVLRLDPGDWAGHQAKREALARRLRGVDPADLDDRELRAAVGRFLAG